MNWIVEAFKFHSHLIYLQVTLLKFVNKLALNWIICEYCSFIFDVALKNDPNIFEKQEPFMKGLMFLHITYVVYISLVSFQMQELSVN